MHYKLIIKTSGNKIKRVFLKTEGKKTEEKPVTSKNKNVLYDVNILEAGYNSQQKTTTLRTVSFQKAYTKMKKLKKELGEEVVSLDTTFIGENLNQTTYETEIVEE